MCVCVCVCACACVRVMSGFGFRGQSLYILDLGFRVEGLFGLFDLGFRDVYRA